MKKAKHKKFKVFTLILLIFLIIFCSYILIKIIKENKELTKEEIEIDKISQNKTIEINENKEKEHPILAEYKGYPAIAKLEIPTINLETYVLTEYSEEALQVSVTKFYGKNPNEPGNFCISGHNYVLKNMFHNLKELNINDEIYLTDVLYGKIKYTIYDILSVYPKQTEVLNQETGGKTELTLITCTRDSKKRIIIKAKEEI